MTAVTSGGGCAARSFTVARPVRDTGNGLAHASKLNTMVRDAADVGGSLRRRLADAALCGGEL